MTPEQQLARLRDPERWEPWTSGAPSAEPAATAPRPARGGPGRLTVALVTAVVFALLLTGTVSLLRATGAAPPAGSAPAPLQTPSTSPSASPSAGTAGALPDVPGATLATWTSEDASLVRKPLDAGGRAIALTASCTGGGSVQWSVSGHGETRLGCAGRVVSGPQRYARDGELVAERKPITVRVTVTGHPRFAVRLLAIPVSAVESDPPAYTVDPTGPDVPAALRTCTADDFAASGEFRRSPHFQGGLVTVRSAASSDCAIRSWPALRYLDRDGGTIGGPADRFGEDGDADPAPPARLVARGEAHLTIELFTLARLTDCGAEQVRSLRLELSGAAIRIPVPASPATGHCTDERTSADGVGRARSSASPPG